MLVSKMDIKIFKQVPRVVFGRGSIGGLAHVLDEFRKNSYIVFIVDHVHKTTGLLELLKIENNDDITARTQV